MSSLDVRNNSAVMKRAEQLKRWEESETNRAPASPRPEKGRKIKFSSGCVFLAACLAGDKEEVLKLLENGADINTANVDGLTALHQACIDDNLDMVEFLVENGADINRQDNEGWTPLHATASCGFVSIARYLVENGADVAAVNSDGDLALDLAIDIQHMPMIEYMQKVVNEHQIDCGQARQAEETMMLNDAKKWLRSDASEVDRPHPKTGATALHVASAKGYTKVLSLLLAGRANVDKQDNDGWTPLHAAAHWSQKEAAEMLVDAMADMDVRNYAGQTCIDVADRKMVKFLEELRANNKRTKRRPSSQIRISDAIENHVEKTPTKIVRVELRTDQTRDDDKQKSLLQKQQVNDTTAEEDAPWRRNNSARNKILSESPTKSQVADIDVAKTNQQNTDSNDVILRRTQSFENDKFYQKYNELRARIKANSYPIPPTPQCTNSSAAETTTTTTATTIQRNSNNNNNNKNNNNNSIKSNTNNTTTTTSTSSTTTASNLTSNSTITCIKNTNATTISTPTLSTSNTTTNTITANPTYLLQRSTSLKDNLKYLIRKPLAPTITTTTTTGTPATQSLQTTTPASTSTLSTATTITPPIRSNTNASLTLNTSANNNGSNNVTQSSSNTSTTIPTPDAVKPKQSAGNIFKNFFKSFVPPVRDEESETQRKAHAKRVRETRRSTQGVTLDEIKSAEELVKKKNLGMNNNNNNNNNHSGSFKLEDASSGTTYPPNNTTIIASAPAVIAAANLSSISTRRSQNTSSTPNPTNQGINIVSRPLSAPAVGISGTSTSNTSSNNTESGSTPYSIIKKAAANTATIINELSEKNTHTSVTNAVPISATNANDEKDNDKENDNRSAFSTQAVIQRRRKPKRRSTGVVHLDMDDIDLERHDSANDGEEREKESGSERTTRSRLGSATSNISLSTSTTDDNKTSDKTENGETIDYKALWEAAKLENDKLKQQLKKKDEEIIQTRATLERFANATTKNSLSEIEKRERRAMERKLSELEEELKQLEAYKTENIRLKEENGALIRVISKLSK